MNDKLKWSALVLALLLAIGLGYAIPKLFGNNNDEPPNPAQEKQRQELEQAKQEAQLTVDYTLSLVNKNPTDAVAIKGLADAYFELGQIFQENNEVNEAYRNYKNAVDNYVKYKSLKPDDMEPRIDLGLAYADLNMYDLAIRELKAVTVAAPKNQRALHSLGWIYINQEELNQAKAILTQSYNLDPNSEIGQESKRFLDQIGQQQTALPESSTSSR